MLKHPCARVNLRENLINYLYMFPFLVGSRALDLALEVRKSVFEFQGYNPICSLG